MRATHYLRHPNLVCQRTAVLDGKGHVEREKWARKGVKKSRQGTRMRSKKGEN